MKSFKVAVTAMVASVVLALSAFAGVASGARDQTGLINLEVTNVLNNNTVTVNVPISAAANICGVQVAAILALNEQDGVECVARSGIVTQQG